MTVGTHPLGLLRHRLREEGISASTDLDRLPENHIVQVSGLWLRGSGLARPKGVVSFCSRRGRRGHVFPRAHLRQMHDNRAQRPLLTVTGSGAQDGVTWLGTHVKALFGAEHRAGRCATSNGPQTSEQDVRQRWASKLTLARCDERDFEAARKVMGEAADIRAVARRNQLRSQGADSPTDSSAS